jgi:hypothetical protein
MRHQLAHAAAPGARVIRIHVYLRDLHPRLKPNPHL